MDLTSWLLRRMAIRPFLVTATGSTDVRLAAERLFRERGWHPAVNPVEANMLVVAGDVDVGRVWQQMPLPKAKAELTSAGDVAVALDGAVEELRDRHRQRSEGNDQTTAESDHSGHQMLGHDGGTSAHEHAEHDMGGGAEHDHGSSGHSMHDHHGHDMGEMVLPGGIPMASRTEDRDGLSLDYLHVFLGPVLADWPPGLVVKAIMQGDILHEVEIDVIGKPRGYWTAERMPARRLDSCARLLAVAGWAKAADKARELRDEVLSGQDIDLDPWAGHIRRSKVLKWSLKGVGVWRGRDAWDRLNGWLDQSGDEPDIAVLPDLLNGAELATARLIVASIDPDTDHG